METAEMHDLINYVLKIDTDADLLAIVAAMGGMYEANPGPGRDTAVLINGYGNYPAATVDAAAAILNDNLKKLTDPAMLEMTKNAIDFLNKRLRNGGNENE